MHGTDSARTGNPTNADAAGAASSSFVSPAGTSLSWVERICSEAVFSFFSRVRHGCVRVTTPDGECRLFGANSDRAYDVVIHHPQFFLKAALHGNIGLGEAYVAGDWSCDDLPGFLALFAGLDGDRSHRRALPWSRIPQAAARIQHALRRNSRSGSRRNIHAHYDLGNQFYQTFLDAAMQYSSARYHGPDDSLETAQQRKMDAMIEKADLQPGDHVLDIGCGWGGFAVHAARRIGCRVTGITISAEQHAWARRKVREAGLEDRVAIELRDYRDVRGAFDKIVSIEMLEAVGHEYFGAFFHACDRLLRAGGRAALQVITIPDQRYEAYRRSTDWIQKHIFPGGLLPSLHAMTHAMSEHSRLVVDELEGMGLSYASTLRTWRERFEQNQDAVQALGFDAPFQRKWRYYFSYCEAGFAARYLDVLQLALRRPGPLG